MATFWEWVAGPRGEQPVQTAIFGARWPTPVQEASASSREGEGDGQVSQVCSGVGAPGRLRTGKGLVGASVSLGHRVRLPFGSRDQSRWNVLET